MKDYIPLFCFWVLKGIDTLQLYLIPHNVVEGNPIVRMIMGYGFEYILLVTILAMGLYSFYYRQCLKYINTKSGYYLFAFMNSFMIIFHSIVILHNAYFFSMAISIP